MHVKINFPFVISRKGNTPTFYFKKGKVIQNWTLYEPISVSELFSNFGRFIQKITRKEREGKPM